MKQLIHKTISLFLALVVLLSSFSFTINKHYCKGEIVNTTFFVNADNCEMNINVVCENTDFSIKMKSKIQQEPCCKNTSELIQGNDNNQQAQEFKLAIPQVEFLTTFIYTFINNFEETLNVSTYVTYKPPLVLKNRQTLFQIFRI